jgi:hypothetical protein
MALWVIPTSTTETVYTEIVEIEGREYVLRFDWSERESIWYLSIYDQDENPLALSLRLVVGKSLLVGKRDPRLPPGQMAAVDATGTDTEAGVDELGKRVFLMYQDAA